MITIEVKTLDTFIDDLGPCYDCAIYWDRTQPLPSGAQDPNGYEVVIEAYTSWTTEEIRDAIRDTVIETLEDEFGFSGLVRDNVRVDGYANDPVGDRVNTGSQPPVIWYSGLPFSPNIPANTTSVKYLEDVRTIQVFNPSLPTTHRPSYLQGILQFQPGYFPRSLNRLVFYLEAWVWGLHKFWETPINLVGRNNTLTTSLASVATSSLFLFHTVEFRCSLRRTSDTQDVTPLGSGVITGASIEFIWL